MQLVWDLTTPNGAGKDHAPPAKLLLTFMALRLAPRIAEGDKDCPVEAASLLDVCLTERAAVKTAEQETGEGARGRRLFERAAVS